MAYSLEDQDDVLVDDLEIFYGQHRATLPPRRWRTALMAGHPAKDPGSVRRSFPAEARIL